MLKKRTLDFWESDSIGRRSARSAHQILPARSPARSQAIQEVRPAAPGRIPPQNLDAERSVLGGILLESSAFDEVQEIVKPEDFYPEAHRKVFEAMRTLSQKSEPIDRVTVKDALVSQGVFASIGGDDFIDLLDKVVPVAIRELSKC